MFSSNINQSLNINLVHEGANLANEGIPGAPNTGFVGNIISQLGPSGCALIVITTIALLAGIILLLRRRFSTSKKRPSRLMSWGILLAAIGLAAPTIVATARAVNIADNTVDADIVVTDKGNTTTKVTQITLDSNYQDGYVVYAYTNEDNKLYNEDKTASISMSQSADSLESLTMNSYGIKNGQGQYNAISTSATKPTKVLNNKDVTLAGSVVPVTYGIKANTSLPMGKYASNGASIHFEIKPDVYHLTMKDKWGNENTIEQKHDSRFVLPSEVPTKDGYKFLGYNTELDGSGKAYRPGDAFMADYVDSTIYVLWEAIDVQTTFNANGGSFGAGVKTDIKQTFDENYILPSAEPTRLGYTFAGYYTEKSGGTQITDVTKVTKSSEHTIYAQWVANTYNISYDLNGGTEGRDHPATGTYDADVSISNPTRIGYVFVGWDISGMDNGTHYYGNSVAYENVSTATSLDHIKATHFKNLHATNNSTITFKAVWAETTYKLSYDANGGVGAPETKVQVGKPAFAVSDVEPTRVGYTFMGWSTKQTATSAQYHAGDRIILEDPVSGTISETTLYAVWESNIVSALFDATGGHFSDGSAGRIIYESYGQNYILPDSEPVRLEGEVFDGWWTEKSGGTQITSVTQVANPNTHTIYAHWTRVSYNLSFDANGDMGVPSALTQLNNSTFTIPNTQPTRAGCRLGRQ